ncbi:hypothetical protein [Oceaniglobus indicus]|uniref:hypothetical protein n=1 Tax=Oceaniglobus indicus TaxID=2047749 RepID=UPI000C17C33B|nr:hypothetical protein [Oceaniglobus indicus]
MSGASPSVAVLLGTFVAVSVIAGIGCAMVFGTDAAVDRLGQGRSVMLGLAASGLGVFVLLLALNPDPVAGPETLRDFAARTMVSTGFCALFWVPAFLIVHNALMRRRT